MRLNKDVINSRSALLGKLYAEEKRHECAMAKIQDALKKLAKRCKHTRTSYQPDPAGGNDGITECLICGARLSGGKVWRGGSF